MKHVANTDSVGFGGNTIVADIDIVIARGEILTCTLARAMFRHRSC